MGSRLIKPVGRVSLALFQSVMCFYTITMKTALKKNNNSSYREIKRKSKKMFVL